MTEVTEDEFIDDPMAAIDKLSDLLESQSETELAELSEDLEKKQSSISRILEDDSELPKPKQDFCCMHCKSAMWFGSRKYAKCYCSRMFTLTYDSTNMVDEITECDGQELV
ncbi:MAG: hypothetical protein II847_03415 [Ruminobacter sp.]|uniref:hypothetical protein n=1 Tax=Ruminobacter sp. TaxID=2774296 RepID=UPI00257B6D12|nr:hypothetical protein [Ruminobacter sp.]MBQ3775162.1 hypothetical protein [Ruminobacter sp.]MBQ6415933.1 hypothetical protein [Butyrivibrio sp.]